MDDDDLDELERFIAGRRERAAAAKSQAAVDERFDRIESSISRLADAVLSPPRELEQAPVTDGEPELEPAPEPEPEPEPELPLERVVREPIPVIWDGDDEPETVPYIDLDTGEERTRKGRRKGWPAAYRVELEAETVEPPQEPTE